MFPDPPIKLHLKAFSKGKQERFWRTCKEQLIYGLDMDTIHSLEDFNRVFRDYIRSYNLAYHSGIKATPFERYTATADQARPVPSAEWLDECFLNRVNRKVRKDSTISIDSVCYDVPMQFIGMKVEVRFDPSDMSSAFILYEKEHFPIRPTNKVENCRTKRNNTPTLQYAKIGGDAS